MDEWYYAKGSKQVGPVSYDDLRRGLEGGRIGPAALVWTEGMEEWKPANQVRRLMGIVDEKGDSPPGLHDPAELAPPAVLAATQMPSSRAVAREGGEEGRIIPGSDPIEPGACIRAAFSLTKLHFTTVFGACLIVLLLMLPLGIVEQLLMEGDEANGLSGLLALLNQVLGLFLGMGLVRVLLAVVDGEEVSVGAVFGQGGRLLSAIIAVLLSYLIIFIGLVLLVVPGIYAAVRLSPLMCVLVDRNELGPLESLKESFRLTEGNFFQIVGLWVLSFFVVLAGILAFLVGLAFAIPLVYFAMVVAYRWLTHGREAAVAAAG